MKLWRVALVCALLLSPVGQVWADSWPGIGGLLQSAPIFSGSGCGPGDPAVPGWKADVQAGYFSTLNGVGISLEARSEALATDLLSVEHKFPVDGVVLGAVVNGPLTDALRLWARAAWFIPFSQKSAETYLFTTTTFGAANFAFPGSRAWNAEVRWYTLEADLAYPLGGGIDLLGGFRFDSFDTRFNNAAGIITVGGEGADEADFTLTAYIPYVGFMLTQYPGLKIGLIGFPYVPAYVKQKETYSGAFPGIARDEYSGDLGSGYFLELFGEYKAQMGWGEVGIFGSWTSLQTSGKVDARFFQVGFVAPDQDFELRFNRNHYTFGVSLSAGF